VCSHCGLVESYLSWCVYSFKLSFQLSIQYAFQCYGMLIPSSDRLLESFTSMGTGKQTGKSKSKAVKSRRAPSVFEAPSKLNPQEEVSEENEMNNCPDSGPSYPKKKRSKLETQIAVDDTPSTKRPKVIAAQTTLAHAEAKNADSGDESDSSSSSHASYRTSKSGMSHSTEGDDVMIVADMSKIPSSKEGVRGRGVRSALSNPATIGVRSAMGGELIKWFWQKAVFDRRGVYHLDSSNSPQVINHAFQDLGESLQIIQSEHEIAVRNLFGRQRNRYIIQKALEVLKKELRQDVIIPDVLALLFDPTDVDGPWGVLGDHNWMDILGKIAPNDMVTDAVNVTLEMIDSGRVSPDEICNKKSFRKWMRWQAIFSGILFHCHSRKHDTTQKPAEFESYVTICMKPVADQLKAFLARRRNGESAPGRRCDLLGVNHQNREDFLVISDSEPDC
jgi:hypothetical protein